MSFDKIIILFILFENISSLLFVLKKGDERCLIDEFLEQNFFVVKHKVFTEDKKNLTKFLQNIRLIVRSVDTNKQIYNNYLLSVKDKITQKVQEGGLYRVCLYVNKNIPREMSEMKIYANLKITSDNMEKSDFSNKIKSEDVSRMYKKATSILKIISQSNEYQKEQINVENENSLLTLSNTKIYKYLNLGQIFVSAIIGIIQMNNFRKFLKSRNIV